MTPTEMATAIIHDIESARAMLNDGPAGYVLHTRDNLRFLCKKDEPVRLDSPLSDDLLIVGTHRSAIVYQRYWNTSPLFAEQGEVVISIRGEGLVSYIDARQATLDHLLDMGGTDAS